MSNTVEPLSDEDVAFLRQFRDSDPRDVTFTPRMVARLIALLDVVAAERDRWLADAWTYAARVTELEQERDMATVS